MVPNAVNAFGEPIYDPLKELETTAAKVCLSSMSCELVVSCVRNFTLSFMA
jgi:hypothetical protein